MYVTVVSPQYMKVWKIASLLLKQNKHDNPLKVLIGGLYA
jgi:hypothetical protein